MISPRILPLLKGFFLPWIFGLLILFWPDLDQPFSTPKFHWLAGGAVVSMILMALLPGEHRKSLEDRFFWGGLVLMGFFSLSAILSPYSWLEEIVLRMAPIPCFMPSAFCRNKENR